MKHSMRCDRVISVRTGPRVGPPHTWPLVITVRTAGGDVAHHTVPTTRAALGPWLEQLRAQGVAYGR
jgi:hypothetical protein